MMYSPGSSGMRTSPRSSAVAPVTRPRPRVRLPPAPHPLRQLPRAAVRLAQHRGGLGVADDRLPGRVPGDLPARPDRDVAEVAHRRAAVPDLHVADRRLARLDALQPVL